MAQQIIIQKDGAQLQVAIVEDNRLAEYHLECNDGYPTNGSIYRGIVESVLPGMQAAFVDIGWERSAYLALEDILLDDAVASCKANIGDILKAGQSIVVQVKKEAVDAKGPKVTTELSLQGKTMVLLPGKYQVNISKKITDTAKRQVLKTVADAFLLGAHTEAEIGMPLGVIIRTAAAECESKELQQEFVWLCSQWSILEQQIKQVQKPGMIANNPNRVANLIGECVHLKELEGIYINDEVLYEALQQQIPERDIRFKLRLREGNLIEQFQLDGEIRTIHKRKVLLPSGASLVFDRTEAMNVVDVNTAGFVGKKELADTIVKTNLEAVREIAWQIRLRNLSGIILIDMIDMKASKHQQQVVQALETLLKRDSVRSKVHGFSNLGLLEVTRQKTRAPLTELLEVPCPMCHERGRIAKTWEVH